MSRKKNSKLPFDPEFDNRVKGELLMTLKQESEMNVTESIPSGPIRRAAISLPTKFGIKELDAVLAGLDVNAITKVHRPISNQILSGTGKDVLKDEYPGIMSRNAPTKALANIADRMNRTFRVRFDPKMDLNKAMKTVLKNKSIAEISPNYFRFTVQNICPPIAIHPTICPPNSTIVQPICPPLANIIQMPPNDTYYDKQWGLTKIQCNLAWQYTKGSPSVIVAVIDTGVDLDHPDLQGNLMQGADFVDLAGVSPRLGWHWDGDFLTVDDDPQDEVGHGTHVAGTIAAVSNNNQGVTGVTWNCKIMPVKVLGRMVRDSDGAVSGSGTAADIAAGIEYAVDHGAHILNMSLGGYNDTFVERDAVAYAIAQGCVVVAAMGNDNVSNPLYPAAYDKVIAVGAINENEKRVVKSYWGSNTGSHISVVAPGDSIISTSWNDTYGYKEGTSMATPHVSGVAALVKSIKPSLSNTAISKIIKATAKPLRDNPSDPIPNEQYGYGLVDAKAAVDKARLPFYLCPPSQYIVPCPPNQYVQMCPPVQYIPLCPPNQYFTPVCPPSQNYPQCPPSPYYAPTCPPISSQIPICPPSPIESTCPPAPNGMGPTPNPLPDPVPFRPTRAPRSTEDCETE